MTTELQKKLRNYSSAAAAVIATGSVASAQGITYMQVNKTLDLNAPIDSIDVNQDNVYDLGIVIGDDPADTTRVVIGVPINYQGHAMAGSAPTGFNYPFQLNSGDDIKTQAFLPDDSFGYFLYSVGGVTPYGSFWLNGVTDGYLGMKFNFSGNTHYGWVRMDVAADGSSVVIKDFAYHNTPDATIDAGDNGLSLADLRELANEFWVNDQELFVDLKDSHNNASLVLHNMAGQEVKNFALESAKGTFSLGDLSAGVYTVSLRIEGNQISKKVVVR